MLRRDFCKFLAVVAASKDLPLLGEVLQDQHGQVMSGGVASGGPHTAVFDSQHRPITAGGFVKNGPVVFENIAKQAGLTTWHHTSGTPEKPLILEAMSGGVCLLDYDNDGWLDIYLVNGSTLDALNGKSGPPPAALFRNNRDGTFTNVAEQAGVTNGRWGFGCTVGDFDNDGWPDLYVTNYGKNRLYRNNHDGTFTDVAEQAGVALDSWSTGATFGDYDGDGNLDLFVSCYIDLDLKNASHSGNGVSDYDFCEYRGVKVMCGPRGLRGAHNHLYHNDGNGKFTDVSSKLGIATNTYYSLGALFADVNNDGKPDLLVANDSTPNDLYINKGNGTFENDSYMNGYAVNGDGREMANMGIAAGDYLNNGNLDIVNTTFADDYDVLFRNDGHGNFTDVSYPAGIAEPSIPFVGFGDGFLDYDNDGWADLFIANGHLYPQVDQHPKWGASYAQRPLLYHNLRNGKFALVPAVEGTGLAVVSVGRGAAFGDLFNTGKTDVVLNPLDGVPVLLRNVNPDHNHWVKMRLVGGSKSPRDAVGAKVYLTAGGIRRRQDVLSGGSYLSSSDMRVHFGLGHLEKVDQVEVHWPSGTIEKVALPAVDRIYTVTEDKGITGSMCGSKPCKPSS